MHKRVTITAPYPTDADLKERFKLSDARLLKIQKDADRILEDLGISSRREHGRIAKPKPPIRRRAGAR